MRQHHVCIVDGYDGRGDSTDGAILRLTEGLSSRGWSWEVLRVREMEIGPCRGCFACWVKTPGQCILADDGRRVAESIMGSELTSWITPVTMGGYSAMLKNAVDRLIPLVLPYFTFVGREVHHVPRYRRYPSLLVVGCLEARDQQEESLFHSVVHRNATNLHAPSAEACIVSASDPQTLLGLDRSLEEVLA